MSGLPNCHLTIPSLASQSNRCGQPVRDSRGTARRRRVQGLTGQLGLENQCWPKLLEIWCEEKVWQWIRILTSYPLLLR